MKLGDVVDIRIGTQLNKTSMVMTGKYPVMNGIVKPSGGHNQRNPEPDSIAMRLQINRRAIWISCPFGLGQGPIVLLQRRKRRMF